MATHTKDLTNLDLPSWIYKPDGWDDETENIYPCLVFFHGNGVQGNGIDAMLTFDAPTPCTEINNKINTADFPHNHIIISPYKDTGDWFPNPVNNFLQSIVAYASALKIDINKIAITGLSLGGIGISQYIQDPAINNRYTPLIACFPIAGGSQSGNDVAQDAVDRNVLMKGWMGENDGNNFANPRMENDRDEMNAIEAGYYELVEIAGGTHSASTWGKVYNRQDANAVSFDIYAYMNSLIAPPDTEPPSVPDGLASSNIKKHSFRVDWNASVDNEGSVQNYDVYLDDQFLNTTENTYYEFESLTPNTEFSIKVLARDDADNVSELSAGLSVTTLDDPPSVNDGGKSLRSLLI
jgi:hypothetical protein